MSYSGACQTSDVYHNQNHEAGSLLSNQMEKRLNFNLFITAFCIIAFNETSILYVFIFFYKYLNLYKDTPQISKLLENIFLEY